MTLLEILLSLAVAVVGIFGVLVLIPVSARMAETGLDLDEAGSLGRKALSEFEVRNMRNPANWAAVNPAAPQNIVPVTPQANKSYCIDPEFLARNYPQLAPATFNNIGAWFPINHSRTIIPPGPNQPLFLTPLPSMHRITLAAFPPMGNGEAVLSEALAKEIFTGLDDLNIDSPEDATLPPTNHFHGEELYDPALNNIAVLSKRQARGEKSWLAILTPQPSPNGLPESDLYTLYIVVYDQRDNNLASELNALTPPANDLASRPGDTERWSTVQFGPTGFGLGGGEALIQAVDPTGNNNPRVKDVDVNRDEWMMVCQRITANRITNTGAQLTQVYDLFRWYRITDVDELDVVGGLPSRYVTLDGPDWTTPRNFTSGGVNFGEVYGVTMTGVLEVYERTVRLESRSIWAE